MAVQIRRSSGSTAPASLLPGQLGYVEGQDSLYIGLIGGGIRRLGRSVPSGGTTGQWLRKASGTDYDYAWGGSAKLISLDGLTVSAGQQVYYSDANTAVAFSTSASGRALQNIGGTSGSAPYLSGTNTWSLAATTAGGRALWNVAGTANTTPYFSASNTVTLQATTAGGRALWNVAGTANTTPYFSASNTVTLQATSAGGRALWNATGTSGAVPYFSAANTYGEIATSANTRSMMAAADYAAVRTLLSIDTTANTRKIPPSAAAAADYTFVAGDAGQMKLKAAADTTARAWTINNGVHAAGDVLAGINNASAGDITLTQGSGVSLYALGSTTASNFTVPPGCSFCVWMESASIGRVSGIGITGV